MKTLGNEIRHSTFAFEVKSATTEAEGQYAGTFEGYAAGIHNVDRAGDMILPGAFKDSLSQFLKDGVVCWQHDWMMPIGKPLEAHEDEYGLFGKCRISNTEKGKEAMTLIRDGVINKLSIGYTVQDYEWVDRAGLSKYLGGTKLLDNRKQGIIKQFDEAGLQELCLLKKIKLYEYSPVTVPANPNATITGAKGLLAGLSFGDSILTALAAVREVKERAEKIKSLRVADGRNLSEGRQTELRELAYECLNVSDEIRAVLVEQKEVEEKSIVDAPAEPPINVAALFAEFQQLEARRLRAA